MGEYNTAAFDADFTSGRETLEAINGMMILGLLKRDGYDLAPKDPSLSPYTEEGVKEVRAMRERVQALGVSIQDLPRAAAQAKRDGDLGQANRLYSIYCDLEEPYSKTYIWAWIKVLLLAKRFEDARFLLYYLHEFNAYLNELRVAEGESLDDYAAWGSKPPRMSDDFNPLRYLRQVSDRPFSTREETEEAIQAYGGSDYWRTHFHLTENDYADFLRVFSRVVVKSKANNQASVRTQAPAKTQAPANASASTGGCYVATAVYGSYDCPEVWTLRRFRDYSLARSAAGRSFIRAYYAVSPTLVRVLGGNKWFVRSGRLLLSRFVKRCNAHGYSDSPYDDVSW